MEYKKKLKQRLFVNLSWAALGLIMMIYWWIREPANNYPLSLGFALIVIGVIRTVQYRETTRDEKALREKEIVEKDERNQMMHERAKSWTFSISLFIAGDIVIILSLLGYHEQALPFAWFVCGMTEIYWICWNILRKKY